MVDGPISMKFVHLNWTIERREADGLYPIDASVLQLSTGCCSCLPLSIINYCTAVWPSMRRNYCQ